MLSKCLNPQCTAKFRYLWEGRLFRIDFSEAKRRKSALPHQAKYGLAGDKISGMQVLCTIGNSNQPAVPESPQKERPIEHFWLCAVCAASLTIAVSDAGEIQLVKLPPEPVATEAARSKLVAAS